MSLDYDILLTTPTAPYPTLPANDSLTDATGQRFTKGDDIFTVYSHSHCYSNHILAQNIDASSLLLEYPRWDDFAKEIKKGYPIIGISAFPVHLDIVMKMCLYIRQRSPKSKIYLGSYGGQAFAAQYDEQTQRKYVDGVVQGEGVAFLRELLGESTDRPIRQSLMPKAGGAPPFISRFPVGTIAFLVSGLGCIGGCDFCSSTTLFGRQRIELLSPQNLVTEMGNYFNHFPMVRQVFVVEEDHFRFPDYLHETRSHWMANPAMMERVDWFSFGSIDNIGKFAESYGWDALAETGIGAVFIGVESKFAGDHGYEKRSEWDAREVFNRLHSMGIRTIGAWICGWDWHDHSNIYEDLNYFVSLYPTYQQLTRLSPFPGTPLWERLQKDGRVAEVPWEDVHFWSGAQKNTRLEAHETLNLTEYGYELLYKTWGSSILRRLDVMLNGYEYCRESENPLLRRHRSLFFKQQSATLWTFTKAMDRHAPNGVVRRRVRTIEAKYERLVGKPTPAMEILATSIDALATAFKVREAIDPINRQPKHEPYKRYIYSKNPPASSESSVPYSIENPTHSNFSVRSRLEREKLRYAVMETAMKAIRTLRWKSADPEVDDYLIDIFHHRAFGFGF